MKYRSCSPNLGLEWRNAPTRGVEFDVPIPITDGSKPKIKQFVYIALSSSISRSFSLSIVITFLNARLFRRGKYSNARLRKSYNLLFFFLLLLFLRFSFTVCVFFVFYFYFFEYFIFFSWGKWVLVLIVNCETMSYGWCFLNFLEDSGRLTLFWG